VGWVGGYMAWYGGNGGNVVDSVKELIDSAGSGCQGMSERGR
jgi:hypothetical protein